MVHTLIYVLIINGLRTKVQSVDKKRIKQIGGTQKYTSCVAFLGRCAWGRCLYMLMLFPQHDFYGGFVGGVR